MTATATVYVIGAGFSAGLGYPLTFDLLLRLWPRLDQLGKKQLRKDLEKVIRFHYPARVRHSGIFSAVTAGPGSIARNVCTTRQWPWCR